MTEYLLLGLTLLFSVIGWLLVRKDAAQQAEIASVRKAREEDQKVTQALSLQLAAALETVLQVQRDSQKLFELHDKDAANLAELRLLIASEHYPKKELDVRFEKLDVTFREGFKELGDRFDRLAAALLNGRQHD